MKSNLYFRHDIYALDDDKIMQLVFKYHESGYGIFWAFVERLTIEASHRIPKQRLVLQTAIKLCCSEDAKVADVLNFCIQVGLFQEIDGEVSSDRVDRQCEQFEQYSKRQSENVKKRWRKVADAEATADTTGIPPNYHGNTTEQTTQPKKEIAKALVEKYKALCPSLPKVLKLTDARVYHANAFCKDFTEEEIAHGFQLAESSDFLKHGSGTWGGANFDWLINKNNFTKVLEGSYKRRTPQTSQSVCNDAEAFTAKRNEEGGFDL